MNESLQSLSVLIIRVEQDFYSVQVESIEEVVPMMTLGVLPETLPFLEGYIEIRGEYYAVIDLRKRFGGTRNTYQATNRILITKIKQRHLAFVVDEVLQVEEWSPQEYQPGIVAVSESQFTGPIGKIDQGDRAQLLHLHHILTAQELQILADRRRLQEE